MRFTFRRKNPEEQLMQLIERLEIQDYILEVHSCSGRLTWEKYHEQKNWRLITEVELEYDAATQIAENERIRVLCYVNGMRTGTYQPENMNECVKLIRRLMNGGTYD